jgi:Nucleotidyl transferase AbiEii toxin, Type IV TA system
VNTNETQSLYPLVSVPVLVPDGADGVRELMVRSYDLDEMLGTKMRALLQRDHGRDLFDLWRAWEHSTSSAEGAVDPARVGKAFRFYLEREGSSLDAWHRGSSCGTSKAISRPEWNTTHGTRTTSSARCFCLTWMPLRNRSGAAPLRWWQACQSASSIPGIKVDRNRSRRPGESNP